MSGVNVVGRSQSVITEEPILGGESFRYHTKYVC